MKLMLSLLLCLLTVTSVFAQDEPPDTRNIWITHAEIMALPISGAGYNAVLSASKRKGSDIVPKVSDQNNNTEQYTVAKALLWHRLGAEPPRVSQLPTVRNEIISILKAAINTELAGDEPRTLALGRNLCGYIVAADLIGYRDPVFMDWVRRCLTEKMDGSGNQAQLILTAKGRPNNWGTMALGSCAAAAVYLDDQPLKDEVAKVFHGYLGDRASWSEKTKTNPTGWSYGDNFWQLDTKLPVPINPLGAMKEYKDVNGAIALRNIDGFPVDDIRRGENHYWPPKKTGYLYEGLQGTITCARILTRAGYPAFEWNDRAILRAFEAGKRLGWIPDGDDRWQSWLIKKQYGIEVFVPSSSATHGKIMGWTSWTDQ